MKLSELLTKYDVNTLFQSGTWLSQYNLYTKNKATKIYPRNFVVYDFPLQTALVFKRRMNGDFLVRQYDNIEFDMEEAD